MQGSGIGDPWRVDHYQPTALLAGVGKGRKQQAEFTYARAGRDQFCDSTARPTATWKVSVQARMTGGECSLPSVGLLPSPQVRGICQHRVKGVSLPCSAGKVIVPAKAASLDMIGNSVDLSGAARFTRLTQPRSTDRLRLHNRLGHNLTRTTPTPRPSITRG